jgi:hypothetical protein
LLCAATLVGCATAPEPLPSVPTAALPGPPTTTAAPRVVRTANFALLFNRHVRANSVYLAKEPGLMKRVLLSPNLVFESSRSSVEEPPIVPVFSGELHYAYGSAVAFSMSSILMQYLSLKGSELLAPVVTRRWDSGWWCAAKDCRPTTWIERILMQGHYHAIDKDGKPIRDTGDKNDHELNLPTAALAVRAFAEGPDDFTAIASYDPSAHELIFRPQQAGAEPSVCKPRKFNVPAVLFQAEMVSITNGRILARIDEERTPDVLRVVPLKREYAVLNTSVTAAPTEADCQAAWQVFETDLMKDFWAHIDMTDIANKLLLSTLGQLY